MEDLVTVVGRFSEAGTRYVLAYSRIFEAVDYDGVEAVAEGRKQSNYGGTPLPASRQLNDVATRSLRADCCAHVPGGHGCSARAPPGSYARRGLAPLRRSDHHHCGRECAVALVASVDVGAAFPSH